MPTTTTTECPGCWDEDCASCNSGGAAGPEVAAWSSMPSDYHGRLTNRASEKQVDFLVKLGMDRSEAEKLGKTKASEEIDRRLKEQGPPPPSERQLNFLNSLLQDKDHPYPAEAIELGRSDRKVCSAMIDFLKGCARKKSNEEDFAHLEVGIYRDDDGVIFKVYVTQHGNGQKVAKELNVIGRNNAKFVYRGKKPLHHLRADQQMTLEEAKEFGAIYGVCCVCSATLTDEKSIEAGIGPICGGRLA